eukprot:scaffold75055_cov36-Phaeocystis_antarctica.AAC.1
MAAAQTSRAQTSKGRGSALSKIGAKSTQDCLDCFDCLDLHYSKPKGEPPKSTKLNSTKVNSKAVTRGPKSTGVRFQRTFPTATHLSTQVSPSHAQALEASPFRTLTP